MKKIKEIISSSIEVKEIMLKDENTLQAICDIKDVLIDVFQKGNKLLLCGNGGSAADASHLASEFSGRFLMERPALFAEAIHSNVAALTAISNDYGYESSFARLVEAKGIKGDILLALSTSGNSTNVIKALERAKLLDMTTVGFTGQNPCEMDSLCDFIVKVPSSSTPRIQECHLLLGHTLCEIVELKMFNSK